jgi:FKBP-type peptidyl-prolyl cis-trans isomerase 2
MKKGDIIRLDITGNYPASGEVFETTDEGLAKDKGMWHEGHQYKPRVLIIGSGSNEYPTGLEVDLLHAKIAEKREVTLEPKDAFGAHNPLLVETVSARELVRLGIEPEVGASVTRRNRTGHISGIFGGRVRVDYNHPLAGKSLKYEYTVREVADKPEEKVGAVLDLHYGRSEEFRPEVSGKSVSIKVPDVCKFDQAWQHQKLRIVLDLREHAGFETVSFVEEYVKKKADEEGAKAGGESAAESTGEAATTQTEHEGHTHVPPAHDHSAKAEAKAEEKAPKASKPKAKAAKAEAK